MSTLADQLRGNAAVGQDQRLAQARSNFRPSYIFSPKQAALLSNDDIFGLGQNGFAALCQITPGLAKFEQALFSDSAKMTDRALLSKEENKNLDQSIDSCLSLLGPSVLVRPCGQILEWLIRRFRIQDFNTKAVLALMLPYHETPQFAQMLQLLPLEKMPIFSALVPIKKNMQPMSRHSLVKAMARSSDLLSFVIDTLSIAVKRDTAHQTLVSFWTASLVSYLDFKPEVTQEQLSVFSAALFEVIKAKEKPDCQLAAYVVVAHLTSKTLLTPDALETIVNLIAVKRSNDDREMLANDEASLTTVVSICLRQEELPAFPLRAFAAFVQRPAFVQTLQQLHQKTDLTQFLRPFCNTLANQIKDPEQTDLAPLTDALLNMEPCPAQLLSTSCLAVLGRELKLDQEPADLLAKTAERLRQRYPDAFGQAVQNSAAEDADGTAKAMEAILAAERSGATLSQGARDADEGVRLLAYQQLLSAQSEEALSAEDAQAILKDPSPTVTALIAPHAQTILTILEPKDIIQTCEAAIVSDTLSRPSLGHLSSFLCQTFLKKYPHLKDQVVRALWPRLLWTKAGKKSTALVWEALSKSPLAHAELKPCFPMDDTAASDAQVKLNRVATQGLATLAVSSTFLQDFLIESCSAQNPSNNPSVNLALLVAAAVLGMATKTNKMHVPLAHLYTHVPKSLEALENRGVLLDEQHAHSDATLLAASVKPKSPKTRAKLLVCLLIRLAETFPVDHKQQAWNWLDPSAAGVLPLRTVARGAFHLAHVSAHGQVRNHLFKALFANLLGEDVFSFLGSLWIESTKHVGVTLSALQDALALLQASPAAKSYQYLLPSLMVPLSHEVREIREAALDLLQQFLESAAESKGTYGQGDMFGSYSNKIGSLENKDYANYLKAILAERTAIVLSSSAIVATHTTLGEKVDEIKKPKKLQHHVAEFLASCLNVPQGSTSFTCILDVVTAIKQPDAVDMLLPVMQQLVAPQHQFELHPDVQDHCVHKLLRTFENTKAVVFENPSAPALNWLRQVIKIQPTTHMLALFRQRVFDLLKLGTFYRKLSLPSRMKMVEFLVLQGLDPDTPVDIAECLTGIPLDSDTLVSLLQALQAQIEDSSKAPKRTKASQTSSPKSISEAPQEVLTLLLERLAFDRLPIDGRVFQAVFEMASLFAGDQTLVSSDLAFIKQRLIIALSDCLSSISAEDLAGLRELRIAPLMDMLRTSPNPQTTQRILSLIAQLTTVVPDQVLQNIIPLFTFMGTSVSQRDDAFAQKVLTKVINCTLPVLVAKTKETAKTHAQLVAELREVLRTLTGLASHIPRFRRATLFAQIVSALGPQDFLAPVMLMLLGEQNHDKVKSTELVDRLNTTYSLLEVFSARDQLAALSQLTSECQKILATASSSGAQQRVATIIAFLRQVFEDRRFVSRVDAARSRDLAVFDQGLQNVIKTLVLLQDSVTDAHASQDIDVAIRQIARLLSASPLSDVIVWLVSQKSKAGIFGGFAILRQSLSGIRGVKGDAKRSQFQNAIEACTKQLGHIISQLTSVKARPDLEEAISTIKEIARSCSATESTGLPKLVDLIVPALESDALESAKRTLLLSGVPALLRHLGPRLLPKAQQIAQIAKKACLQSSSHLQEQGLDILQAILQSLGNFVSPFVGDLLFVALQDDIAVKDKLRSFRLAVARQIPLKTLSPALVKTSKTVKADAQQLLNLLRLTKSALDAADPADVLGEHKRLFPVLLQSWEWSGEAAADIHATATSAFLAMVLQLNESSFKPLLLRTIDWAFVEADTKHALERKQQMLAIMSALLQALKIVALPYFSYLVEPVASLLENFVSAGSALTDAQRRVWEQALSTLKLSLSLDQEGFWTETRLRKLIGPVVSQLQLNSESTSTFEQHFRPTLCAFAQQCSTYEDVLKDLNTELLDQTRSDHEDSTRAEALLSLAAMWRNLRDPLLPLVPQTTPFIVEALEERGDIEAAARDMVAAVEDCLGEETLADYMT